MRISFLLLFSTFLLTGPNLLAKPLTVLLDLKPQIAMSELARQVSDPKSDRYRRYFTPQEIRQLAGPAEQDYQIFIKQLRHDHVSIIRESNTRLWVAIALGQKQAEKIFQTRLNFSDGRHQVLSGFHIPDSWALVERVTGLNSGSPRFANHVSSLQNDNGVPPEQIKAFYGIDKIAQTGINGLGQHIAIATYDNTNLDDIRAYYSKLGLSPLPTVDQIQFNGVPPSDDGYNLETTLDAELSGMIAPGASIHLYTSAENTDAAETLMFATIFDDNRAKIVNYSWSSCEKLLSPSHRQEMEALFQRAVAQGINVFVASGDTGSEGCQGDNTVQAAWPSTDPNVVTVGGTSLNPGSSGSNFQESAWGPCGAYDGCSGGGISVLNTLPSYQQNFHAPFLMRSYPDVSFNADLNISGQAIWMTYGDTTGWNLVGGTSMAAPQWCGIMALIGQARQKAGKGPIGFLNPILYAMNDAQRAKVMMDITAGSTKDYNAGLGWDALTGWGSPSAAALLSYLQNY